MPFTSAFSLLTHRRKNPNLPFTLRINGDVGGILTIGWMALAYFADR